MSIKDGVFQLYIRAENAAFYDEEGNYYPNEELSRILEQISDEVVDDLNDGFWKTIFDRDGNDVGRWAIKESGQDLSPIQGRNR